VLVAREPSVLCSCGWRYAFGLRMGSRRWHGSVPTPGSLRDGVQDGREECEIIAVSGHTVCGSCIFARRGALANRRSIAPAREL